MKPSSTPEHDDLATPLLERWMGLFPAEAASGAARIFGLLMLGYLAENRHYHNLVHLDACLREFDAARPLAADARAVELALFFHDAIYDPRAADNEEYSAEVSRMSLRQMGETEATIDRVAGLVLATKHNAPAGSADEQLIIDIDLAILGQPADIFDAYDRAIRLEYAHVPDDAYAAGRRALLEGFLARARIYGTDLFFGRYEAAARENLQRAIAQLKQEP